MRVWFGARRTAIVVLVATAITASPATACFVHPTVAGGSAASAPWRPRPALPRRNALLSPDAIEPVRDIATGGALALAGDVIAQSLTSEKRGPEGNYVFPPEDWDKVRTAAFVAFGGLYTGGVQHFIFGFLNAAFDDPIKRLLMAQFFFIPFCYYPTFIFMVPTLRAGLEAGGKFNSPEASIRRDALFAEVYEKIPSTLVRNWCFWLPVQYFQFNFIPTDLQVTYCAAFGVIWNAILSWSTSSSAAGAASEKDTSE